MENKKNEQRVYEKNRFEFSIFVNENLVCKRNFRINNFSDCSFHSMDFKDTMDKIVKWLDDDLKSKSRVYLWYNVDLDSNEKEEDEMPLPNPWETTFKIVVTDNEKEVFSKIWDGSYYPPYIKQNVDIINKYFQVATTASGEPITKEYSKIDKNRLDNDHYMKYMVGKDRENFSDVIIKAICEVCSPERTYYDKGGKLIKVGKHSKESDFETNVKYGDKSYNLNGFDDTMKAWEKSVSKKTQKYFDVECNGFFE
jgi:hypothetical protein